MGARSKAGDRLVLTPERLDLEGRGVADLEGEEFVVEGLLPGEQGEAVIEHVSRHARRSFATLSGAPLQLSPDRTPRVCPAPCGGCAWQHLAYPAQLAHKRRRVEEALSAGVRVSDVVPAPELVGYRNKATYVIARPDDRLALGAWAPRSHDWVDTSECRVVHPTIAGAARAAAAALDRSGLEVYAEATRAGHLRYLVLRASRSGDVLAGIVTTSDAPRPLLDAAAAGIAQAPGVRGVLWLPNDAATGAILGAEAHALAGSPRIAESIGGIAVEVAIDTFLQVNLGAAEALYQRLVGHLEPLVGRAAVDLYCGIGPIALMLARRGADVVGIERNPAAIASAREAAARNGLAARFDDAAAAGQVPRRVGDRPLDIAVVNPPRQGLSAELRADLAAAGPPVLAYVSCGPESLGRDLAELAAGGYRLDLVEPFDLMPGTGHVETLVIARRGAQPGHPL
jgi:23S rRNA (uracil1939-C5)-methyltransferase